MKVFISADIEGISCVTDRVSTMPGGGNYDKNRRLMTNEVIAAAQGAHLAGADEVFVRDSHGFATNIEPEFMPEYVTLIRNWSGDPKVMLECIDESFDALLCIGYHSAAGKGGNSLAHTMSSKLIHSLKINGQDTSEFMIGAYTAAYYGVPSVFLSGDKLLCEDSKKLFPALTTVAVKEDFGGTVKSISPQRSCLLIKEGAQKALQSDLSAAKITLPKSFQVELCYKDHVIAYAKSFYPGAKLADTYTVSFSTDDWYEVLRLISIVVLSMPMG